MVSQDLCQALLTASSNEGLKDAADKLALEIKDAGVEALEGDDGLLKTLDEALASSNAVAKEGGCLLFAAIAKKAKTQTIPFLVNRLMPVVLLAGDKKSKELGKAASKSAKSFAKSMTVPSVSLVFDEVCKQAKDNTEWKVKVLCMELLGAWVENAPEFLATKMTELVPLLSALMWDSKKQVKEGAAKSLAEVCKCISNNDIQPFVPALVDAIAHPENVEECIHTLAATTFVQTVDSSALSITVPLLERGFREKKTAVKRKSGVITENLAKLVENPAEVEPFMGVLEPALARASEEVADPECRTRCAAAHEALKDIAKRGREVAKVEAAPIDKVEAAIKAVVEKHSGKIDTNAQKVSFKFLGLSCQIMGTNQDATKDDWLEALVGPIKVLLPAGANKKANCEAVAVDMMNACLSGEAAATGGHQEEFNEDEDDKKLEMLCDCRFSLAYGSRILLNNSRLLLRRGMRYGIVAAKSAGKTTLLTSIANGQVEGFPVDRLKTIFVQTDIPASKARLSILEFAKAAVQEEMKLSDDEIRAALISSGFEGRMDDPITSFSGGQRMKLALTCAMLRKADILLMDEPTNHLDVLNVQWVVDYLLSDTLSKVTSLIVSHDTKFLDNVATHVIHFDTLKLNNYKGNLSKFVERFPHAKAYYDLTASALKFSFPKPKAIDGVKSRGRPILTMTDVSFTYPGCEKPQLTNINVRVSMASRIACVGANGAGKSTMIKLLTGEMKPDKGVVYKHPNCSFAYIAQHAFTHLHQHLDKTPNEYIQWRYQGGEDKEALVKATVKVTEEEEAKMKKPIEIVYTNDEGKQVKEKRVVEKFLGRRKQGKILEYETKFVGKSHDSNIWYPREKLEELGFKKLLDDVDRRKAAAEANFARTLSQANIEAHLEAVGLERELASHNRISSLSGGQQVKVVLGACTWSQPHLIILDEPTNYLDREALGALAGAINDFEGGVCLITHNQEFADACTRETWVVANHTCDIKGDADWAAYAAEALELAAEEEDQLDAMGNKVERKRTPESVPAKEKKKMIKELKKLIKEDLEMTDFQEECATAWGLFAA
jgi:elongation factor 3